MDLLNAHIQRNRTVNFKFLKKLNILVIKQVKRSIKASFNEMRKYFAWYRAKQRFDWLIIKK